MKTKEEVIKEGLILIAVDECEMEKTGYTSLTIGKKYKIIYIDEEDGEFSIIDDCLVEHFFDIDGYSEFFKIYNNGWIRIESEEDLPKDDCKCFIMQSDILQLASYTKKGFKLIGDYILLKGVTHYQPIIKPKPPLY